MAFGESGSGGRRRRGGRRDRDEAGDRDEHQARDLEDGQDVLRARRFAQPEQVDGGQDDHRQRRIDRRRVRAERQHAAHVVAEHEREQCDGARRDHRHARPGEEEAEILAVGARQEVVVASRAGEAAREFRVAERADQRQHATQDPCDQHPVHRAGDAGDHRRRLEDAGSDDDADRDHHGVEHGQHRARRGRCGFEGVLRFGGAHVPAPGQQKAPLGRGWTAS